MKTSTFTNATVWLTGASRGMGEAMAYALNKAGARVIISARNRQELERVRANCAYPEQVEIVDFDLSDIIQTQATAQSVLNRYGNIDYLIHNAAVALRDTAINTSLEVDQKIMATNYFGPIALTKAVLPHMLEVNHGHIVVVTSTTGKIGLPRSTAYAASKHALHGFFESLRAEIGSQVDITMILPGIINTNITCYAYRGDGSCFNKLEKIMTEGRSTEWFAKKALRAILNKREEIFIGGPQEGAALIVYKLFPGFFRWIIRNHPVKRMRKLKYAFSTAVALP